jgi:hypothetical protein
VLVLEEGDVLTFQIQKEWRFRKGVKILDKDPCSRSTSGDSKPVAVFFKIITFRARAH